MRTISDSTPVARKAYSCDACDWILGSGYNGMGFTFSEMRTIARANKNGWKIVKGQKYLKQVNDDSGDLLTFRCIPEIHDICIKHELYDY